MSIGNKIRKILEQQGVQARELADKIGVSEQAMSNYLNGRRSINIELLAKISNVLNVPIDLLLNDQPSEIYEVVERFNNLDEHNKEAILTILKNMNK